MRSDSFRSFDPKTSSAQSSTQLEDNRDETIDYRKRVETFFGDRMYINLAEAAEFMNMSTKTLRLHADLGNIGFSRPGFGRKKVRRSFTARDVARFCILLARGEAKYGRPPRRGRRVRGRRRAQC